MKYNSECLQHYTINYHNVVVSDFTVEHIQDHGCAMLQFTGNIGCMRIEHATKMILEYRNHKNL